MKYKPFFLLLLITLPIKSKNTNSIKKPKKIAILQERISRFEVRIRKLEHRIEELENRINKISLYSNEIPNKT